MEGSDLLGVLFILSELIDSPFSGVFFGPSDLDVRPSILHSVQFLECDQPLNDS